MEGWEVLLNTVQERMVFGEQKTSERIQLVVDSVQENMNQMHEDNVKADVLYNGRLDKMDTRLDRHRENLNELNEHSQEFVTHFENVDKSIVAGREERRDMQAVIDGMVPRLCACGDKSVVVPEDGSQERPFEVQDGPPSEYHTPPATSGNPSPPSENSVPIPIPFVFGTISPGAPVPEGTTSQDVVIEEVPSLVGIPTLAEISAESRRLRETTRPTRPVRRRLSSGVDATHPYRMALGNRREQKLRYEQYDSQRKRRERRRIRRLNRQLGGYESSSESGSQGLSCDTECGDGGLSGSGRGVDRRVDAAIPDNGSVDNSGPLGGGNERVELVPCGVDDPN
jgi:hypothetical protein